ncbi:hypothetical protein AHMF7605_28035 [Adhaeribacter arboris]|uniref:Uncharacterized protein n=1 Tax=Adhaeribacter arboris TaxID=2072846 RepID=A0A2T2YNJ9_9BACT|nr:hypothetical protein [Adhaeribacter arboris]PSR57059.1 hypothetical protein AHMF7605_28035 [Adhaeribacter arboris]
MATTPIETAHSQNKIKELFSDPTALLNAVKNPSQLGLDLYNSLSPRNKQYLVIAGGVGLIIYGLTLNKKK